MLMQKIQVQELYKFIHGLNTEQKINLFFIKTI